MIAIDLTGMVLKDRYCILEQIGKGGGGSVYLARDMELGVQWAVKELPLSGRREAKLLLSLEHHSLPKMVDYIENAQYCYIIMEYINGENMRTILDRRGSLDVEEAVNYGISLAETLEYLHGRKPPVFYGDLKPENLMVSASGKLYLIDFGSAVIGYPRERNLCMGTEGFAAPEQYEGKIGETSDVYGLGKTLEAFLGGSALRSFLKSPALFLIIRRCCCKREKLRYRNMEILEKKIRSIQRRTGKYWIVAVPAAVCAVLLLTVIGAAHRSRKQPDFYELLTETTAPYYSETFQKGNAGTKRELCEEAEMQLRELLEQCESPEEQAVLEEMLEANQRVSERTESKKDEEMKHK